jgi:hypothetical protein
MPLTLLSFILRLFGFYRLYSKIKNLHPLPLIVNLGFIVFILCFKSFNHRSLFSKPSHMTGSIPNSFIHDTRGKEGIGTYMDRRKRIVWRNSEQIRKDRLGLLQDIHLSWSPSFNSVNLPYRFHAFCGEVRGTSKYHHLSAKVGAFDLFVWLSHHPSYRSPLSN